MVVSKFQQMMLDVEREKRQRQTEQGKLTWQHFQRHPECKQKILTVGRDGFVIRSKTEQINWLGRVYGTWLQPDPARVEVVRQPTAVDTPQAVYQLGRRPVIMTQFMARKYLPALQKSAAGNFPHLREVPQGPSAAQAAAFT